uniref:RHS repeat-associated core domain-containing protein n=1 Tax=Atopomonas hussainii TaxID=1429083 RepID=UPI001114BE38
VTWRAKAQAFGETQVTLNTIDNPLRFPGQYYDPETGLYYNYFRDYDPQLGRYVQADPIGLRGGLNIYVYALNNPLRYADPKGKSVLVVEIIVVAAAVVVGAAIVNSVNNATRQSSQGETGSGTGDGTQDCPKNCPPCRTASGIVPVGTIGYRPLDVIPDDQMQHGVYGSHHNIFVANQNPNNCQCFWQKKNYVLKPEQLPFGAVPVEPFIN